MFAPRPSKRRFKRCERCGFIVLSEPDHPDWSRWTERSDGTVLCPDCSPKEPAPTAMNGNAH